VAARLRWRGAAALRDLRRPPTFPTPCVIEPFELNGGEIPTGGYAFDEASLELQSSAGEPFSAGVSVSGGGYFQGDRRSVGGSFRWLVSHRLAFQGSADYNRIDLPTGTFTSSVYAGRVKFALSTRAFAALNVQYNEAVDQLVTYGRFNVIHGPLSDLFLVLTERRGVGRAGAGAGGDAEGYAPGDLLGSLDLCLRRPGSRHPRLHPGPERLRVVRADAQGAHLLGDAHRPPNGKGLP